jgi:hypothetical protein
MFGVYCGQGRMSEWLHGVLGVDSSHLHPSVRFGLEGALLMAIAEHRAELLSRVLGAGCCEGERDGSDSDGRIGVSINGLLDGSGSRREVAAEAARLAGQGHKTLKMKVRSRSFLLSTVSTDTHCPHARFGAQQTSNTTAD